MATDPLTLEQIEQIATGKAVLRHAGQETPHHLKSHKQRAMYEEAKMRRYIITGPSKHLTASDAAPYNCYFLWCEAQRKPFPRLAFGPMHSWLEVDFITLLKGRQPSQQVCDDAEEIVRSYPFAAKWQRAINGDFSLGPGYWHIGKFPSEHAHELMTRLLALLANDDADNK